MFKRVATKASGPGAPKRVPSPGAVSSIGPKAPALPKVGAPAPPMSVASKRNYGKTAAPVASAPQPSPFGPVNGGF
jgi:hypothetical protein